MSAPARALFAVLLTLVAVVAARPAYADAITFRFDISVTDVHVNPGDVFDPYVAAHFKAADPLALYVSWDPDQPVGYGDQYQGALKELTLEGDDYHSHLRPAPGWNFLSTSDTGTSFNGYADLARVPTEPALPFQPYYFEFRMEFPFGMLQPGELPRSLPSQPLTSELLVALGSDYYTDMHFVSARIDAVTKVPEAASLLVFGTGVSGLVLMRRRQAKAARASQPAPTGPRA